MKEYFDYRNKILKEYFIISTIFLSLFFLLGEKSVAFGFALGAAVSGINFYLISLNNLKLLSCSKSFSQKYLIKWFFLRYLMFFIAGIVALKSPDISFSGVAIGFFSIQMAIFYSKIILRES